MINAIYSDENLCKEEILDTIDMILNILASHEDFRPKMSDELRSDLARIGGDPLPPDVEEELKKHEIEMDKFMTEMGEECKKSFPKEFNRLKDRYPGIIHMVLRYGEHADFVRLRRMLDLAESMEKKRISPMDASYRIGRELRNNYVNPCLGINESDINEINPNTIDIDKIRRENPHIFK